MKNAIKNLTFILLTFFLCEAALAQTASFYNVAAGNGNGLRFWNGSNSYKITMGSSSEYRYGPVTGFSIKNSMTSNTAYGFTWGVAGQTPTAALNTEGSLQIKGWFKTMGRRIYFGDSQYLEGNNTSALTFRSNHSSYSQLILKDKEGTLYGKLFGSANGAFFGLQDGDGSWSYLARKDLYTDFRINNSTKMRIRSSGNVGIGTLNPQNRLDVCGTIRGTEVRVQSGWCDYVFDDAYQLPTLEQEEQFIKEKGHLDGFDSAVEMDGEIQLGDVTKRQQETIEKLMLHMIELNKEIKALKAQLPALKH